MEHRLENALMCLIEDYIRSAEPVSSRALVLDHGLDVSSATVRNWFAVLEEEGYLIQPHTSAGRVPSEAAYRWYVEHMGVSKPAENERALIRSAVSGEGGRTARIKRAAKVCAEVTKNAALVGTNASDTYYTGLAELFSQPEFRDWSRVISMSAVLDQLDFQLNKLRKKTYETPSVLLGEACPFGNACGSILISLKGDALLAMLGPIRMDYKKGRSVLRYLSEAL
jgi:transcriptional regulator of heat shock response